MSDDGTVTLAVVDAETSNRLIGQIHQYQTIKQGGMVDEERINQAILRAAVENPEIVEEIVSRQRYL